MTRGEIKRRIRLLGRHYFGSDNDQDPFGLDLLITEVANQIARGTDCYFGRRYLDLLADTKEYCAPDLYKIRNIQAKNNLGEYRRMRLFDAFDQKVDQFRSDPTASYPEYAVIYGMNRIGVYPIPQAGIEQGLMVEGYAVPGDYWVYSTLGVAQAPTDTDECPLPDVAHDCLVYGVLANRAAMIGNEGGFSLYNAQYNERLGLVESYAATYTRRTP
jgi:hypothetical protein